MRFGPLLRTLRIAVVSRTIAVLCVSIRWLSATEVHWLIRRRRLARPVLGVRPWGRTCGHGADRRRWVALWNAWVSQASWREAIVATDSCAAEGLRAGQARQIIEHIECPAFLPERMSRQDSDPVEIKIPQHPTSSSGISRFRP